MISFAFNQKQNKKQQQKSSKILCDVHKLHIHFTYSHDTHKMYITIIWMKIDVFGFLVFRLTSDLNERFLFLFYHIREEDDSGGIAFVFTSVRYCRFSRHLRRKRRSSFVEKEELVRHFLRRHSLFLGKNYLHVASVIHSSANTMHASLPRTNTHT